MTHATLHSYCTPGAFAPYRITDIFFIETLAVSESKISAINKLRDAAISQELEAGTARASFERHLAERYIVNSVIRAHLCIEHVLLRLPEDAFSDPNTRGPFQGLIFSNP
jgi:hypothetical protein